MNMEKVPVNPESFPQIKIQIKNLLTPFPNN